MKFNFTGLDKYSSDRVLEKIEHSVENSSVFLIVRNENGKITAIEREQDCIAKRYESTYFYCYKGNRKKKIEVLNGFYIQVDNNKIRFHRPSKALPTSLKEELKNIGNEKIEFLGEELLASEIIKLLVKLSK